MGQTNVCSIGQGEVASFKLATQIMRRTTQRTAHSHSGPARFAEQYKLEASDPGHEARVPENATAASLSCTVAKRTCYHDG